MASYDVMRRSDAATEAAATAAEARPMNSWTGMIRAGSTIKPTIAIAS